MKEISELVFAKRKFQISQFIAIFVAPAQC